MSALVLEHDPDDGCGDCPLLLGDASCGMYTHPWNCGATGGLVEHDVEERSPAPAWCPLRAGAVTVRKKGGRE
jgi:hypothetical protein